MFWSALFSLESTDFLNCMVIKISFFFLLYLSESLKITHSFSIYVYVSISLSPYFVDFFGMMVNKHWWLYLVLNVPFFPYRMTTHTKKSTELNDFRGFRFPKFQKKICEEAYSNEIFPTSEPKYSEIPIEYISLLT